LIVDTSALIAYFDRGDRAHAAVSAVIDGATERLVVSPYVVAELDYIVATRRGVDQELAVLGELASGAWDLPSFDAEALADARAVIQRYADQDLGVTDASIVVLAARYQTRRILTLDHRHFDVVRPLAGGRFRVLP
jgi:predicted nucleic acid-binding protein